MYLTFLMALLAGAAILAGGRVAGLIGGFLTIALIGGLLIHHMTDPLPIAL